MSSTDGPRVSIIVPVHNRADLIAETLESVVRQTMESWECIVVDDGSTDGSRAVVESYVQQDERFRLISTKHLGLPAARNAGIDASSGEFIQFLDADDILDEQKLEQHAEFLKQNPDVDIVYGRSFFFRTEAPEQLLGSVGGRLKRPILNEVQTNAEALAILELHNIMPVLSPLTRRKAIARAGGFDDSVRAQEDHDLWLRCAITGAEFHFLESENPVAKVRVHSGMMTTDSSRMARGYLECARSFPFSPAAKLWSRDRLPLIYEVWLGIAAVERGERLAGSRRIRAAAKLATQPLTKLRWRAYGLAALILPRGLFTRFVETPVPELLLAVLRRLSPRMKHY